MEQVTSCIKSSRKNFSDWERLWLLIHGKPHLNTRRAGNEPIKATSDKGMKNARFWTPPFHIINANAPIEKTSHVKNQSFPATECPVFLSFILKALCISKYKYKKI